MANTGRTQTSEKIPMTIMWNPRVWTTTQVSPNEPMRCRVDKNGVATAGKAEVAFHLHCGPISCVPRGCRPKNRAELGRPKRRVRRPDHRVQRERNEDAHRLLAQAHGGPRIATADELPRGRRVRECCESARGRGSRFHSRLQRRACGDVRSTSSCRGPAGRCAAVSAKRGDANAVGSLPLLEAPTIGGNTYGYDVRTIQPIIRADLSYLAPAGEIATTRRAITIVSHPGTIDATSGRRLSPRSSTPSRRFATTATRDRSVSSRFAQLAQAWR